MMSGASAARPRRSHPFDRRCEILDEHIGSGVRRFSACPVRRLQVQHDRALVAVVVEKRGRIPPRRVAAARVWSPPCRFSPVTSAPDRPAAWSPKGRHHGGRVDDGRAMVRHQASLQQEIVDCCRSAICPPGQGSRKCDAAPAKRMAISLTYRSGGCVPEGRTAETKRFRREQLIAPGIVEPGPGPLGPPAESRTRRPIAGRSQVPARRRAGTDTRPVAGDALRPRPG